jgi:hypothetical protein
VTSPVALEVDLPANATTQLVFRTAQAAGLQVRELGVRRESVEAAFLRVIGDGAVPPSGIPQRTLPGALAEQVTAVAAGTVERGALP